LSINNRLFINIFNVYFFIQGEVLGLERAWVVVFCYVDAAALSFGTKEQN